MGCRHPAMTYADGFFGSSEDYSRKFKDMFPSLDADYVSARSYYAEC